ncbi:ABC transporter ATP-binding protein [Weissella sagaensis]|uniref:ABC transporter ATP-binding protein n=1 Tax=Weissella sagaensis TaxID=2559928 RepID=A0ABW1RSJ0_9LACO|nr:ABC transporter ATP-binding protein [Weissella sagaensis]QDJ58283.1 ABC transporter ATP-binding protein [Weissella hellenica]QEA57275.1 ABC transporter ATP-binding protein [Weissella hellenica]UEG66387.1 ABC transporter ATP-binding protein [Weissella hellenica]
MGKTIISLNNVQKNFGNQPVLKEANFNVQQGEIVGLIGPSGAGKSTIIKIVLGMEKANEGQALVFNTQMPNRELLNNIGYMAQADALYDVLTGYENLYFFAQMNGIKKAVIKNEIQHVSQVVELTEHLAKKVSGYSGGMKRRLSLAIALLGEPDLLILDEPTVGIDPGLKRKIWRELYHIKEAGRTILVTTHAMDEAELTDRVVLLLDGKIIADKSPKELEDAYQVDSIEAVFLKAEGEQ